LIESTEWTMNRIDSIWRRAALVAAVGAGLAGPPPALLAQQRPPPAPPNAPQSRFWEFRSSPQADLWFHALAVIAADDEGPLGLYSADYAERIRDEKRRRGVYPTKLDSLTTSLREQLMDDDPVLQNFHFIPLYFPEAAPERLIAAVRAIARRKPEEVNGRDVRSGMVQLAPLAEDKDYRQLLEQLADAMQEEWEVFYRGYWEARRDTIEARIDAVQSLWDTAFAPALEPYLEGRRLSGGIIMPSAPLGPEGRIVDGSPFVATDQVVSVQFPVDEERPEGAIFAFLKELCFLLIDQRTVGAGAESPTAVEDLRRRAAVRCGALLLQFYAPTRAAGYRRVFLDAVGAKDSYTVAAFERVYDLEPREFEAVREEVRRR
jgi:hypothetical protein